MGFNGASPKPQSSFDNKKAHVVGLKKYLEETIMTLREKMLEIGVTPKAASRRTNAIAKEHKVVAKAVSWGIDTFGEFAPTKMSDIRKAENSDIFKAIARVAFQRGYKRV